ncbi:MAG: dienelactone hydrolase family protein [Gammaproteobacteria bacterium]
MRKVAIALFTLIVLCACLLFGYLEGFHIKRETPAELEAFLSDHYEVFTPEGTGPFPTVVGYHGCSGTLHGSRDWARFLNKAGYAVVHVESIKPRELDWPDVCSGKKLWGSERAGDIMVSLDAIRNMPFVNPDQLHLIGWSHGGWSIMDALTFAGDRKRPPNLKSMADHPLSGVQSATLFYPFCEFPARGRHGWPQDFPVHFMFAETDSIVSNAACEAIISKQVANGKPTTSKTYANTDHAFDMRDEDFYDCCLTHQPDATREAYADMLINLRRWTQ